MGNNIDAQDDFYIGWQAQAPDPYATKSKRFIGLLAVLIPLLAFILVMTQQDFKVSVFEFGQLSEIEGLIVKNPIPLLKIKEGNDRTGNSVFKSILLVGFGKKGATTYLEQLEQTHGDDLYQKQVVLRGTLIYYNGKTMLELAEGTNAETSGFAGWGQTNRQWTLKKEGLGEVKLRGEIYDSKCALGVMKPGNGKPHRSCAIRCISGGVPPMLRVANKEGEANYFLILDREGQALNHSILDFVGDQIQICGRLEQQDDWLLLYTDPQKDILRLQPYWMEGDIRLCSQN